MSGIITITLPTIKHNQIEKKQNQLNIKY